MGECLCDGPYQVCKEHLPEKYTVADALNNALAAVYANVGPSMPLVDIRRAMKMLGIPEDRRARNWVHYGSGYTPEMNRKEIPLDMPDE